RLVIRVCEGLVDSSDHLRHITRGVDLHPNKRNLSRPPGRLFEIVATENHQIGDAVATQGADDRERNLDWVLGATKHDLLANSPTMGLHRDTADQASDAASFEFTDRDWRNAPVRPDLFDAVGIDGETSKLV